jgi:hypothetical protein
MKKLRALIRKVPKDRQPIAKSLFNELVFMQNTLETLKAEINADGPVSMFKQGKQQFLREHPAEVAYTKLTQRYSQLFKQITDLLPPSEGNKKKDELLDFIKE